MRGKHPHEILGIFTTEGHLSWVCESFSEDIGQI